MILSNREAEIFVQKQSLVEFAALTSGGKDSLFASYFMVSQGWTLKAILKVKALNTSSYMFHTINIDVVDEQAKAIGVPLYEIKVSGEKEREVEELTNGLKDASSELGFRAIVLGAVSSEYQRARFDRACEEAEIKNFSPLWHKEPVTLFRSYLSEGFKFIFSGVYALGLDHTFLGRIINKKDLERLVALNKKYGVNIVGEGGEYESLVLFCPLFERALKVYGYKKIGLNRSEFVVTKVQLVEPSESELVVLEHSM